MFKEAKINFAKTYQNVPKMDATTVRNKVIINKYKQLVAANCKLEIVCLTSFAGTAEIIEQ